MNIININLIDCCKLVHIDPRYIEYYMFRLYDSII